MDSFIPVLSFHSVRRGTWPVVEDFIAEGEGRVWVRVRSGAPDNLTWIAMNGEGERTHSFQDPEGEEILTIANGKVYSARRTGEEISIRRYVIRS